MVGLGVGTSIAWGVFMVGGGLCIIPNACRSTSSHALGSSTMFVMALLATCAAAAIAGVILGAAQWSVLRGRLANAHQWIWATCIGALVGFGSLPVLVALLLPVVVPAQMLGALTSTTLGYILPLFLPLALVAPLAIGIAQWFVLRPQVPRASRWIGANIIGLLTAAVVIFIPVIPMFLIPPGDYRMAGASLIFGLICVPFCMPILAIVGLGIWLAITGVTLARLLEQRTAVPAV
jgi:hypothetical protein